MSMTIKELKQIISVLPDETILLIEENNISDVGTVNVQYHSGGITHLVFTPFD